MIKFDKLWAVMEQKGVTTYALREKGGIDSKTIRRLRNNENMETKTLDKLCKALDCKLEDIAECTQTILSSSQTPAPMPNNGNPDCKHFCKTNSS